MDLAAQTIAIEANDRAAAVEVGPELSVHSSLPKRAQTRWSPAGRPLEPRPEWRAIGPRSARCNKGDERGREGRGACAGPCGISPQRATLIGTAKGAHATPIGAWWSSRLPDVPERLEAGRDE